MDEWMSVKEKIPPVKTYLLFFTGKKEICIGMFLPEPPPVDNWATENSIWVQNFTDNEIATATHWMSLPKPPARPLEE